MLLLGISKSGFGAGFGSLAVPMIALAVTVPQAAAILMPLLLLLMDLLGIAAFHMDFDFQFLKFLVPFGLMGTVLGALLFQALDARTVAAIVGGFTLLPLTGVRPLWDGWALRYEIYSCLRLYILRKSPI